MADLADQIDALREEIGYLEWGLGEREWPPEDHPRDDHERLAALHAALALLEALADREWVRDAIRLAWRADPDEPQVGFLAALLARAGGGG
ncbi:MAG TPA: hypothetical protein VGR45_02980 [Stellaceae bacterium]|nr:hypothetical protein [Stellaceae bacterium]